MTLSLGSAGPDVAALQRRLETLGFDPGPFDGDFGHDTDKALRQFQGHARILMDGEAGPETMAALGLTDQPTLTSQSITPAMVAPLFPGAPMTNITRYLPPILAALDAVQLGDRAMILMALGTIRAECAPFAPLTEGESRFNTSPGGQPFDLYNDRRDLGNMGPPDGAAFRGRGFVQLTGRANYIFFGSAIDEPLAEHPELAAEPVIAARLLAEFLKAKESKIRAALADNDLATARRLVNGGSNGLANFIDTYRRGLTAIPGN